MNLILFTEEELKEGLPADDRRARHLLTVLRRGLEEPFDVGIINGRRGKARLRSRSGDRLTFDFELTDLPEELFPLTLMVGLSRPQTMRRILRDATSLGVGRLLFFTTERGEAGYAQATLFRSGEYRTHLIDGAQQAFSTRLPAVRILPSLSAALAEEGEGGLRVAALDNYEADRSLRAGVAAWRDGPDEHDTGGPPSTVSLIVGSERGWSAGERLVLREHGVPLLHLGGRVLRTEVACISAVSIALSMLGFLDRS